MQTTADAHFDAGRLADAVRAQTDIVRASPSNREARFVLFALLCFSGDLERAEKQLEALGVGSSPAVEMQTVLQRSLLACEAHRREVWAGRARPLLSPDAPPALERRADALARLAAGDGAGAGRLLDEAAAGGVGVAGVLNGEPFDQLRDSDDFGASVLEVFAHGHCLWLSFEQVRRLELQKPETLLDLLWPRAKLLDARGNDAIVHLPALYAGSHAHADGAHRIGRATSWEEAPGAGAWLPRAVRGAGQKVLLAVRGGEERECALLDIRSLTVNG
jgi:type VI secretion system protein ImpE